MTNDTHILKRQLYELDLETQVITPPSKPNDILASARNTNGHFTLEFVPERINSIAGEVRAKTNSSDTRTIGIRLHHRFVENDAKQFPCAIFDLLEKQVITPGAAGALVDLCAYSFEKLGGPEDRSAYSDQTKAKMASAFNPLIPRLHQARTGLNNPALPTIGFDAMIKSCERALFGNQGRPQQKTP